MVGLKLKCEYAPLLRVLDRIWIVPDLATKLIEHEHVNIRLLATPTELARDRREYAFLPHKPSAMKLNWRERVHFRGERRTSRVPDIMIIQRTALQGRALVRRHVLRRIGVGEHVAQLNGRIKVRERNPSMRIRLFKTREPESPLAARLWTEIADQQLPAPVHDLVEKRQLFSVYDFENRDKLFPAVDSRMKFSLLTLIFDILGKLIASLGINNNKITKNIIETRI